MTPKEFFDKVVEMRRCQKEYFKNKRQIDLRISKQIEREVDEEIERVQKILHDKQNPQLFQTMVNMKILDLPLKAKWYEMIESGNKKEEYREIKKYWIGRLAKCGGRNSYEKTGFYCKKAICFSCITRGNGFHPKEYTHSKMFQDVIFEKATAMKFLRNRIRFFRPDGTRGDSPGCGSILIAFGEDNAEVIKTCDIAGKYVRINQSRNGNVCLSVGEKN